ncbi:hypothetical protein Esi_0095_0073 [Ectocarpus siliculosus]|uniref:Uncharacterized protein n=1 Tax=Ectocarpus siliculosus TaxID=2880 RepID=D8LU64_ECTSI|nr:hypothetical protein Esi_0095_0073 [Ectocarpus siliculosus]|eukprot:CBN78106.1 hypothetical protein Esi_0095_0073 [Ectocarpus siliculosus]
MGNPDGGVVRAGVGACTGHVRTTRSRGVPPGAGMGGVEHLRSRKRRSGSISAGASFSRLMQQGGGKEAPGFDAAVRASAASSDGNTGGVEVAAVADAVDAGDDDKSSSSDGGAAHEDLSAWLHSTHDWWTSD